MGDRVAIVTGGTRAIGRAVSLRLAQDGYTVAANYRANQLEADQTLNALVAVQPRSLVVQADVSHPDEAQSLVNKVLAQLGRVDVLVNNVGPWYDGGLLETTPEQWRTTLDGNLSSAFYCLQAALPAMRAQRHGVIINIGAMTAESLPTGDPYSPVFGIAKAAVALMVRNLAYSEGRFGIRANAVSPGLIETEDYAHIPPDVLAEQVSRIALGRVGQPQDIAAAVSFLASDGASYITGAVLHVHGGLFSPGAPSNV